MPEADVTFEALFDETPQAQSQAVQPLSDSLSVRAFFDAVPWNGTPRVPAASPPPQPTHSQPQENDLPVVVKTTAAPLSSDVSHPERMQLSVRAFFDGVSWDASETSRANQRGERPSAVTV